jgi:hypothetical protein
MFNSDIPDRKFCVPINSVNAYKSATNWSDYADDMVGVVFEDENLVSGQNIKTINGASILGTGNISTNGGNADTVDGKHASDFATVNHTHYRFNASLVHFDGAIHICHNTGTSDEGGSEEPDEYGNITGIYFSDTVEEDIYNSAYTFIREEGEDRLRVHSNFELTLSTGGSAWGNRVDGINGPYINLVSSNAGGDEDLNNRIYINAENGVYINGDITAANTISSTGKIYANGGMNITGDTIATGTITSAGFYQSSDERLKIFKSDINIDLDKLAELRKSYFTFIEDPGTNRLGVSAQEIQELYPEIVTEGADGFLKVDYSKLSVIALKAIDILYNKNKELEDRLNKIEKMLNL